MTRTCTVATRQRRRGLTRIEVMVVILILGLLACFLAPATRTSRRAARKLQYLNNIRNVALAMHNYASDNKGALPPLVSKQSITLRGSRTFGTMRSLLGTSRLSIWRQASITSRSMTSRAQIVLSTSSPAGSVSSSMRGTCPMASGEQQPTMPQTSLTGMRHPALVIRTTSRLVGPRV